MKYFIITKKHIRTVKILIASLLFFSAAVTVFLKSDPKTVKTFSPESILKSQLTEVGSFSTSKIKEKFSNIFDFSPSSIISEYSPGFDGISPEAKTTPEPTTTPTPTVMPTQNVEEKTIVGGSKIKNQTKYEVSLSEFENEPFSLNTTPTVLIVHTHTTESYAPEDKNMYYVGFNSRSCDSEKNVIAIGEVIAQKLREKGITVIHDATYHDYPVYNGAYGRSLATINSIQKKNPAINVILDVHRDAVTGADGNPVKVITDIGGKKTAQVMLVVGTNGSGLAHPDWGDNLTFAAKVQKWADVSYPGLMRPLNLREERFNQHTTKCSIIVEVGTNANTLSEAKAGATLVGEAIASVLSEKSTSAK